MEQRLATLEEVAAAIESGGLRMVMVLGATDSGKTWAVEQLAQRLGAADPSPVAIVDCDIGQSHIGPPATVAWGKVEGGFGGWRQIDSQDIYFVGDWSPSGNLLPLLTGSLLMARRALTECKRVIVDTSGLVAGPYGAALKLQKIDSLRPDLIVALQREEELERILRPLGFLASPAVARLPVGGLAAEKTRTERRKFRLGRFREYFREATMRELSMQSMAVRFVHEEARRHGRSGAPDGIAARQAVTGRRSAAAPALESLARRLVSLRDAANRDQALGIVIGVDARKETILVKTPLAAGRAVALLVAGVEAPLELR